MVVTAQSTQKSLSATRFITGTKNSCQGKAPHSSHRPVASQHMSTSIVQFHDGLDTALALDYNTSLGFG